MKPYTKRRITANDGASTIRGSQFCRLPTNRVPGVSKVVIGAISIVVMAEPVCTLLKPDAWRTARRVLFRGVERVAQLLHGRFRRLDLPLEEFVHDFLVGLLYG